MDFTTNHNVSSSAARATSNGDASAPNGGKKDGNWRVVPGWLKASWIVLLFAGTVVIVGVIGLLLFSPQKENELVNKDKYQAVFLDNGQVYFGKVKSISNTYVDLQGIYYLNVSQPVQPKQDQNTQQGNITLQKLGCELHGPVDQMVINRDHVTFWENLRDDAKVTEAIAKWLEDNPNGMKCEEEQQTNTNTDQNNQNNN